jgi:hypothetical protein
MSITKLTDLHCDVFDIIINKYLYGRHFYYKTNDEHNSKKRGIGTKYRDEDSHGSFYEQDCLLSLIGCFDKGLITKIMHTLYAIKVDAMNKSIYKAALNLKKIHITHAKEIGELIFVPTLKSIKIRNQYFGELRNLPFIPDSVESLILECVTKTKFLNYPQNLTSLKMIGAKITKHALKLLPGLMILHIRSIKNCKTLKHLPRTLTDLNLGYFYGKYRPESYEKYLKTLPKLQSLRLNNKIFGRDFSSIATLTKLKLYYYSDKIIIPKSVTQLMCSRSGLCKGSDFDQLTVDNSYALVDLQWYVMSLSKNLAEKLPINLTRLRVEYISGSETLMFLPKGLLDLSSDIVELNTDTISIEHLQHLPPKLEKLCLNNIFTPEMFEVLPKTITYIDVQSKTYRFGPNVIKFLPPNLKVFHAKICGKNQNSSP